MRCMGKHITIIILGLFLPLVLSAQTPAQKVENVKDRPVSKDGMVRSPGEFLVFSGTRTFTVSDKGFHYYFHSRSSQPLDTWPKDWTKPDEYWQGVWWVRVKLINSPKGKEFTLQPCIWMHDTDGKSTTEDELESCGDRLNLERPGVYEITTKPLANWWHKAKGEQKVDISRPHHFKRLGLVLRKVPNGYISPYNITPNNWKERDDYLPFDFHLTIVAVAYGATFSGWENYPLP
jgi:hypothetical protein